jgi:hypothetical protein
LGIFIFGIYAARIVISKDSSDIVYEAVTSEIRVFGSVVWRNIVSQPTISGGSSFESRNLTDRILEVEFSGELTLILAVFRVVNYGGSSWRK